MFTDIEGYTALVAEDEERALSMVRDHRKVLEEKTLEYGGEVMEFYGDGSLSIYQSAVEAVECAIEMQREYAKVGSRIPVRIGIHLGDIVQRDGSIFGNGVNVASRIESIGIAGNILISHQVNTELSNHAGFNTKSYGKFKFKNVSDEIELFAVDHPDTVIPQKSKLRSAKGKPLRQLNIFYLAGIILLVAGIGIIYNNYFKEEVKEDFFSEKIAVTPFKNFTGESDLDYIGEMAAHWLTKELLQTESANVLSFYTNNEIQQLSMASFGGSPVSSLIRTQGAVNILEGTYNILASDSIEFSAFVKRLDNGEVLHVFDMVVFHMSEPTKGIRQLASTIKGYWDARDENLLSMPNFEAYRYYMKARSVYRVNDSLAVAYMLQSIKLDSTFLDPHFLLLGYNMNIQNYVKASELIERLDRLTRNMTDYEKNILDLSKADLKGKNKLVYNIAVNDEARFDRDYFTITDYLIYALEYVNNPQKTIELFNKHEFTKLDLNQCLYCLVSLHQATAAYIRLRKWDKARHLLKLFPEQGKDHWYYSIFFKLMSHSGSDEEFKKVFKEALFNLPTDIHETLYHLASRELLLADRDELSHEYAEHLIESGEDPYYIGWAYHFTGRTDLAAANFERVLETDSLSISLNGQLGVVYAILGQDSIAHRYIDRLERLRGPYQFGAVPYHKARIELHLDNRDTALSLLRQSVREGAKFHINRVFNEDFDLMPLFDDSEFIDVTQPMSED